MPALSEEQGKLGVASSEVGASRRIRPGTKAADMTEGPPLMDLADASVHVACLVML